MCDKENLKKLNITEDEFESEYEPENNDDCSDDEDKEDDLVDQGRETWTNILGDDTKFSSKLL